MIRIKKLSKRYGKNQVLNSIDLELDEGKIYGIMGENGAGKTTFFRCLAGLEDYSGKIISDYSSLKNKLGLLLTEPFFFSKITGEEYIKLLIKARSISITNLEEKNIFDLPLDQYASTYSTGMKKKLVLTAIPCQPNTIYILDKPFNGVDIQSNIVISEIIKKLKSLNKTVLISSHIFSTLADSCDEILMMENGKISQRVGRHNFHSLEEEMKKLTVTNRIEQLGLE